MSLFDLLEGGSGGTPTSSVPAALQPRTPASTRASQQPPLSGEFVSGLPDLGAVDPQLPLPLQKVAAGFAPAPSNSRLAARDSPFALDPVDVESRGPGPYTALAVANNVLIVAQDSPPKCLRIYLDGSKELDEIELELPKKPAGPIIVRSIFMDPTARHAILCCGPDLTFFLGATSKRARLLTKIKGVPTCVAWNRSSTTESTATGATLLGMSDTSVWEVHFEHVDESSGGFFGLRTRTADPLKFAKQIATLPDPPTFLQFDPFPIDDRKFAITAATVSGKLMQFIGNIKLSANPTTASGTAAVTKSTPVIDPGSLEQVFNTRPWTLELPPIPTTPLLPVSITRPVYAGVQLGAPTKLSWLTASGIYAAPISFGSQATAETLFDHPQLYALAESVLGDQPVAIVALQFHFILVGPRSICAVSSLVPDTATASSSDSSSSDTLPTLRTVWSTRFPTSPVLAVAHDLAHGTIWAITASDLFELTIKDEDRDIWRFYLVQNKFELALTHAKSKQQRDLVAKAQADHYFESKRYVLSAKYYAQAALVPFEQVTLQFIERGEMDALRAYLGHVLDAKTKGGKVGGDSVEATMVAMWLFELLLEHLNEGQVDAQEARILEASVREFISKYHPYLEPRTVSQLCASYNRDPELLHFYIATHDHANILAYWIDRHEWDSALAVLERQIDTEMFYRFVPLLVEHAPARIAQILIAKSGAGVGAPGIDIVRLVGAYIKSSDPAVQQAAIPLMEHAVLVKNRTEPLLHNYLVQLYAHYGSARGTRGGAASGAATPKSTSTLGDEAQSSSSSSSAALLAFLQSKPRHYHLDHALRVCHAAGQMDASIYLLTELDRVAQAVALALDRGNVTLAVELAKEGGEAGGDEVREHWLAIVKYLVDRGEIGRVLRMVRGSQVLRLEDVLGLLPEVSNMDDFRDDLVAVLEDYTQELAQLETNMDATFKSLEDLQRRAARASAPIARFDPSGQCDACNQPLMPTTSPSAIAGLASGLSAVSLSASAGIVRSVAASQRSGTGTSGPGGMVGSAHQQAVGGGWMAFGCGHVVHAIPCARSGAADCPVCGEVLLHDLDVPLYDPLDRSWAIE